MATSIDIAMKLEKDSEGCRLRAYPDPATGREPWTIGYGATGPNIGPNTKWTQQQAEEDLRLRNLALLARISPKIPNATIKQLAACLDFSYNCGLPAMLGSTWFRSLRRGNYKIAATQILAWNKAAGRVMVGLTNRRKKEAKLILGEYPWR